jgi:hypothetical protein
VRPRSQFKCPVLLSSAAHSLRDDGSNRFLPQTHRGAAQGCGREAPEMNNEGALTERGTRRLMNKSFAGVPGGPRATTPLGVTYGALRQCLNVKEGLAFQVPPRFAKGASESVISTPRIASLLLLHCSVTRRVIAGLALQGFLRILNSVERPLGSTIYPRRHRVRLWAACRSGYEIARIARLTARAGAARGLTSLPAGRE